jgi:hydroxypyruvate isomerase
MNGYLEGRLADDAGADKLLASAVETLIVGKRLGVHRLNLHGTGLGDRGYLSGRRKSSRGLRG